MYAGLAGAIAVSSLLIIFALYAPVKVENMILGGGIIRSGGNTKNYHGD